MRLVPVVVFGASLLCGLSARAQIGAAGQAALDELLSERESPEAFTRALERAKRAGVNAQALLEARFLYHVDQRDDSAIAGMLKEFQERKDAFDPDQSAVFSQSDDWLAVIEYVTSIDALLKNDKQGFKRHITEAFWLSPRQAAAFTPHIEHLRLQEQMSRVKFDFETRLAALAGGDAIVLADMMKERKAMVLHFWSPWSPDCEAAMPDLSTTAATLEQHGVAVLSLVPHEPAALHDDAREILRTLGAKPPGAWAMDRVRDPLARLFRIQEVPVMVLLSNDGRVLFNGHPGDERLWTELAKLNPALLRPASAAKQ